MVPATCVGDQGRFKLSAPRWVSPTCCIPLGSQLADVKFLLLCLSNKNLIIVLSKHIQLIMGQGQSAFYQQVSDVVARMQLRTLCSTGWCLLCSTAPLLLPQHTRDGSSDSSRICRLAATQGPPLSPGLLPVA